MGNNILTTLSYEKIRQYYAAGHWKDDTLYTLVRDRAIATPNHLALRDSNRSVSYGQLAEAVERFAHDLNEKGVKSGQRVAVWLSSRLETAVVVLACSRNGLVCCPSLHRNHTAEEVLLLMTRMNAAAFIGEEGYGANLELVDIYDKLNTVSTLKAVYKLKVPDQLQYLSIHDLFGVNALESPPVTIIKRVETSLLTDPNAICYLAFTSGTTGEPKGVMHSSNTLLANARAMANDWAFSSDSVFYTLSPLSHNLGFGAMVLSMAVGATLVVHDLKPTESLLDRLTSVGATFAFGVPVHAADLLREQENSSANRLKLAGFRISGASAPSVLVSKLLSFGVKLQSGYGMTEGCSHHYTLPTDSPERVIRTSGRACPGYEVKIMSQEDSEKELPVGQIGQIVARGASLMLGYYDNQKATEDSYNTSGWFLTGDIGYLDADGYIAITGRKKDVIIRGGHNIFPAKIEELTYQFVGVERAAAIPVPDERLGEKVCIVVMAKPGSEISPDDLLEHLYRSGLSKFDMPEYFLHVDEIPLTASGKILKRAIVDAVASGQFCPFAVRWTGPKV